MCTIILWILSTSRFEKSRVPQNFGFLLPTNLKMFTSSYEGVGGMCKLVHENVCTPSFTINTYLHACVFSDKNENWYTSVVIEGVCTLCVSIL